MGADSPSDELLERRADYLPELPAAVMPLAEAVACMRPAASIDAADSSLGRNDGAWGQHLPLGLLPPVALTQTLGGMLPAAPFNEAEARRGVLPDRRVHRLAEALSGVVRRA